MPSRDPSPPKVAGSLGSWIFYLFDNPALEHEKYKRKRRSAANRRELAAREISLALSLRKDRRNAPKPKTVESGHPYASLFCI
ncbi:hypothetical protein AVEN_25396-1 [Araneus ventricosus]|uniref:BZIP domain-containing protein n=1 Tax=Araneus ventricosus TaxID=182803 RepID=A0A4Y2SDX4_ARAVE|nr:hypothetical protein AVEN_25396-1 [Araneus ventricosus]